ncbi:hypothetical protein DVH24_037553 [Malus domestica]|uniref:Uncharacterized protein n=1 Tax=Malus domestica TaxID=3750 RepID=A0A498IX39_MALDO|nr:hypothetical protein DVH24_037553 [Malus domestica]
MKNPFKDFSTAQGKKEGKVQVCIRHMSNLISNQQAASWGSQTPSPGGSATTTYRPNMGTTGVPSIMPLGPTMSTAPTSLTSSVTHPVLSARRIHRQPRSSEKAQQSGKTSPVHGKGSQIGGSKFLEIDMFKEVYVRPENKMMKQLHSTMVEKGQTVLKEVDSQLPLETPIEEVFPPKDAGFQIMTNTLDQTLGRRHASTVLTFTRRFPLRHPRSYS